MTITSNLSLSKDLPACVHDADHGVFHPISLSLTLGLSLSRSLARSLLLSMQKKHRIPLSLVRPPPLQTLVAQKHSTSLPSV